MSTGQAGDVVGLLEQCVSAVRAAGGGSLPPETLCALVRLDDDLGAMIAGVGCPSRLSDARDEVGDHLAALSASGLPETDRAPLVTSLTRLLVHLELLLGPPEPT